MHHLSADDTQPATTYESSFDTSISISEMIAETLSTMSADESLWPNVLAPERVARDMAFTKTF